MRPQSSLDSSHDVGNLDFFEIFPLYVIKASRDTKIEEVIFNSAHSNNETKKWKQGIYLNALYHDNPLFIHFLNKAIEGQKSSTVLKLSEDAFEIFFSPNKNEKGSLKGVTVCLKRIHELRQKSFKILAVQEEIQLLKNKLDSSDTNGKSGSDDTKKLTDALAKVQDHLKQSEKMAALGMNLSSIAHEIKNPVGFIVNSLTGLKSSFDELTELISKDIDVQNLVDEINFLMDDLEEGAVRTGQIARSLGIISRKDDGQKEKADINDLLRSTLIVLKYKTKHRIEVKTDFAKNPKLYSCFPGQLSQVFMNIITNAVQSIPEKSNTGQIKITTVDSSKKIDVAIEDNGIGMDEAVSGKIFDPLFTTKKAGEGTGLGMSISKEIIDLHNGKIKVDSKKGEGTKFTISFPKD